MKISYWQGVDSLYDLMNNFVTPRIERLEFMCIANEGNAFSWEKNFVYKKYKFEKGLFGNLRLLTAEITDDKERISFEQKQWPAGVTVQSKVMDIEKKPGVVYQDICYSLLVSKTYSSMINDKASQMFKHQEGFFEEVSRHVNEYTDEISVSLDHIYIGHYLYRFREHGLKDLSSKFQVFVLAKKILSYIQEKYVQQFEFSNISITIGYFENVSVNFKIDTRINESLLKEFC